MRLFENLPGLVAARSARGPDIQRVSGIIWGVSGMVVCGTQNYIVVLCWYWLGWYGGVPQGTGRCMVGSRHK